MRCMHKYLLITLLIVLCSLFLPTAATAEDQNIRILDTSSMIAFPASLVFNISAESTSQITRLRLNYKVDRMNYVDITGEVWPNFTPAQKVDTNWSWDMRRFSLPPFTSIEYWWTVEDSLGGRLITSPTIIIFEDLRYEWQSLTRNDITLHWYDGSQSFAEDLMDSAQEAVARLTEDTGTDLQMIDIYIYSGSADLQSALIAPREWTGGGGLSRI